MTKQIHPTGWDRIERRIRRRAEFRCECGTFWACHSGAHHGRCLDVEGSRSVYNKRRVALRVVPVGPQGDWRDRNLIALCLKCWEDWQRQTEKASETTDYEDGLFDHLHNS